jgi:hypothetical protein
MPADLRCSGSCGQVKGSTWFGEAVSGRRRGHQFGWHGGTGRQSVCRWAPRCHHLRAIDPAAIPLRCQRSRRDCSTHSLEGGHSGSSTGLPTSCRTELGVGGVHRGRGPRMLSLRLHVGLLCRYRGSRVSTKHLAAWFQQWCQLSVDQVGVGLRKSKQGAPQVDAP